MHPKNLIPTFLCSAVLLVSAAAGFAASEAKNAPAPKAAAKDTYPLKTCVVSDEALGSMGDYISYIHKEAGKPDREIRFCCDGCIDDFKKEPAKFLKKLDDAAKAQAQNKSSAPVAGKKQG
jgi:hypothetical protein